MPHSVRDIPVTSELAPYRTYATPSRSSARTATRLPKVVSGPSWRKLLDGRTRR
jgi:hypothetical protein